PDGTWAAADVSGRAGMSASSSPQHEPRAVRLLVSGSVARCLPPLDLLLARRPPPPPAEQVDVRAHLGERVARRVDAIDPRNGIEDDPSLSGSWSSTPAVRVSVPKGICARLSGH